MASVGVLTIEMAANIARLQRDMNQAKDIVGKTVGQVKGVLGTLGVGIGIGAVVNEFRRLVTMLDDLDEQAQGLGTTAVALAEMREQAKYSGVEAGKLDKALSSLATKMNDAAAGNRQTAVLFERMGVSIKTAAGELRPMEDVLSDVADRFATYRDSTEKTALANALFGEKLGRIMIPYLNQGGESLRRFSGVTDEVVESGKKLQEQLDTMNTNIQKLKLGILSDLIPALNKMSEEYLAASKAAGSFLGAFGLLLKQSAQTLEDPGEKIRELRTELDKLQKSYDEGMAGNPGERYVAKQIKPRIDAIRKELEFLKELQRNRALANAPKDVQDQVDRDAARGGGKKTAPNPELNREGESFLDTLRKQVERMREGEFAMLRLEAAQKKVSTAAEPYIRQLENAKRAQEELAAAAMLQGDTDARQRQADEAMLAMDEMIKQMQLAKSVANDLSINQQRAMLETQLNAQIAAATFGMVGAELERTTEELEKRKLVILETYDTMNAAERDWLTGWKRAMAEYVDIANNGAREAAEYFRGFTSAAEDAFTQLVMNGRLSVRALLSDLAEMLIRSEFRKLLANLFPGAGGGAGAGGSILGSILGSLVGFANGGNVTGGRPIIVGERGPEVWTPPANGTIIPNHMLGGSQTQVTFAPVVHIDSRTDRAEVARAVDMGMRASEARFFDRMRRGAAQ